MKRNLLIFSFLLISIIACNKDNSQSDNNSQKFVGNWEAQEFTNTIVRLSIDANVEATSFKITYKNPSKPDPVNDVVDTYAIVTSGYNKEKKTFDFSVLLLKDGAENYYKGACTLTSDIESKAIVSYLRTDGIVDVTADGIAWTFKKQ